MKCSNCGSTYNDKENYCRSCGNKLENSISTCRKCGKNINPNDNFCFNCGEKTQLRINVDKYFLTSRTKNQERRRNLIKEALNTLLKKGKDGFVIFNHKESDFFVQYAQNDNNLTLDFPYEYSEIFTEYLQKFKNLMNSEGIKYHDSGETIQIEFRNDIETITYITEKIFRDVFNLNDEFELKVELKLTG